MLRSKVIQMSSEREADHPKYGYIAAIESCLLILRELLLQSL